MGHGIVIINRNYIQLFAYNIYLIFICNIFWEKYEYVLLEVNFFMLKIIMSKLNLKTFYCHEKIYS